MSHSMQSPTVNIIYNFNSDFSGDLDIRFDNGKSICIPCRDILALAARYVRNHRISEIENMGVDEILGVSDE